MKKIIMLLLIIPFIIAAAEPTLKDYYRMGYDEGREYAKKNKIDSSGSFCTNSSSCLSLSFTDAIMGITVSAAYLMFAPLFLSDEEAIYDGWGMFTQTSFMIGFEMLLLRGVGLLYERARETDEFDILKKKKDYINDSYKAGFIEGAKTYYNKKVRF
ncbi:MAG: hypothetical protein PHW02_01215 [bacterium]|nr:hypothetical protein [bacterium]